MVVRVMTQRLPSPRTLVAVLVAALIPSVAAMVAAKQALTERRVTEEHEHRALRWVADRSRIAQELRVNLVAARLAVGTELTNDAVTSVAAGAGVQSVELRDTTGRVLARGGSESRRPPQCPPLVLSQPVREGVRATVTVDSDCVVLANLAAPRARPTIRGAIVATSIAALVAMLLALLILRPAKPSAPSEP